MSASANEPLHPTPESLATLADRRGHRRFAGPFDGRRVGALDTPVRIYD